MANKVSNSTPSNKNTNSTKRTKKTTLDNPTQSQIEEAAKKVVKKRTRPDSAPQPEEGDNRKYLNHSLRIYNLPKVDMSNSEQVAQRVEEYFRITAEDDMKPSVAGLALALDIDKAYLWAIRTGERGKNPAVVDTLKKAMHVLDLQMTDYMQNGRINPVSGIFLMKNNFGYADKQEVTIQAAQSPLGDTKDTKQLEEQYLDSVIVVDPEENKE